MSGFSISTAAAAADDAAATDENLDFDSDIIKQL